MPRSALAACLLLALPLTACSSTDDGPPSEAAVSAPVPGVTLPPDALRELVPTPAEVPPGMTPLLTATGARDLAAIAAFSADPAAAAKALRANGFQRAYVVQYANQRSGEVLSVVAVRFASAKGATADLAGDVAASTGTKVVLEKVGEASSATTQALPQDGGELLTLRFRSGPTTWLVAYGKKPKPDPAVAIAMAKRLLSRATA